MYNQKYKNSCENKTEGKGIKMALVRGFTNPAFQLKEQARKWAIAQEKEGRSTNGLVYDVAEALKHCGRGENGMKGEKILRETLADKPEQLQLLLQELETKHRLPLTRSGEKSVA